MKMLRAQVLMAHSTIPTEEKKTKGTAAET